MNSKFTSNQQPYNKDADKDDGLDRDKLGRRRPKKRPQQPFYSDKVRAWAVNIYKMEGSAYVAATKTGIPRTTILNWAGNQLSGTAREMEMQIQDSLADRLEKIVHLALDQIEATIGKANAKDAATIVSIAVEKMRLLREQSTAIHSITQEDILIKLASLRERYPQFDEEQLRGIVLNAIPEAQQWITQMQLPE